jgi:hypothetical protein
MSVLSSYTWPYLKTLHFHRRTTKNLPSWSWHKHIVVSVYCGSIDTTANLCPSHRYGVAISLIIIALSNKVAIGYQRYERMDTRTMVIPDSTTSFARRRHVRQYVQDPCGGHESRRVPFVAARCELAMGLDRFIILWGNILCLCHVQ